MTFLVAWSMEEMFAKIILIRQVTWKVGFKFPQMKNGGAAKTKSEWKIIQPPRTSPPPGDASGNLS